MGLRARHAARYARAPRNPLCPSTFSPLVRDQAVLENKMPAAMVESLADDIVRAMDPEVLARVWAESYAPVAPFVLQLTNRGQRTHAYFCAGDVHGWWEELFGYHREPVRGVWYDISSGRLRGELATVLFDAHGYAAARFEQSGIDPRQKPHVPDELPNVAELLARTGEKCEICFEPWSEECALRV